MVDLTKVSPEAAANIALIKARHGTAYADLVHLLAVSRFLMVMVHGFAAEPAKAAARADEFATILQGFLHDNADTLYRALNGGYEANPDTNRQANQDALALFDLLYAPNAPAQPKDDHGQD